MSAAGDGGYARALTREERDAQLDALTDAIATFDIVITTAQVPGGPAPVLVSAEAVAALRVLTPPVGRGHKQIREEEALRAAVAAVATLLAWEHSLVKADDLSRVNAAFFTMNGYVSVIFLVFWAADIFLLKPGA